MEKNSQKKILIVDDVELVRVFLQTLLERYEFSTELATNGQEAVNIWEKGDFVAILMDLDMPIMGGLEATRIIRQQEMEEKRTYTPIVAVSGTAMANPHRECTKAGMDAFLPKPVLISDVLDVILPLVK